jgi:hypothetical protein
MPRYARALPAASRAPRPVDDELARRLVAGPPGPGDQDDDDDDEDETPIGDPDDDEGYDDEDDDDDEDTLWACTP